MRPTARAWLSVFAAAALPSLAAGGEVQRKDQFFRVEYSDGSVERYGVRWVAFVDTNVREEGGPAVLDRFDLFEGLVAADVENVKKELGRLTR